MKLAVVDSDAQLRALRADWRSLSVQDPRASIFTSWDWQVAWWRHYGRARTLHVLVASEAGRVTGILPLYRERARVSRLVPLTRIRFIGTGGDTSPDYLGPLCRADRVDAVCAGFSEHLVGSAGRWDVLALSDMPAVHPFTSVLTARAGRAGLSVPPPVRTHIFWIRLPGDFETYLAGLSRNRRSQLRRRRRRLAREAGYRFLVWDDPLTLDRAMDRLAELHRARFVPRGTGHAFGSAPYVGFHREIAARLMGEGALRLYCLEVGGALIAMLYCFRWRDRICYFQGGFDPAWARLAPGSVLFSHAIEHAIGEGAGVFDMLKGEYAYKKSLCNAESEMLGVDLIAPTPGGYAYALRHHRLPALKRRLLAGLGRNGPLVPANAGVDDGDA